MEHERNKFFKKIQEIPILIPIFTSIICIYGFIVLYSAAGGNIKPWAQKQIIVFLIFIPASIILSIIDLRIIYRLSYLFYIFTVILLVLVELMGKSAMGATRWINLGLFSVQPSELFKIALILMLSRYFHEKQKYKLNNYTLIIPIIAALIPIALIIKQPDLGTGIIATIVGVTLFFISGIRFIYFLGAGSLTLISFPAIWFCLHKYQQERILTFLNPERDPLGSSYNIIQSKIAIGSGGMFGKGFLSGTQSHLNFLPEYQTDFIFAFLTEEFGFIGGVILLLLYLMLILNSLSISLGCRYNFTKFMVIGIVTLFFSHIFVNIAMVMGMLPTVGVPLPFISYGRTMMTSMLLCFSLVMNSSVNGRNNI